MVDIEFDLEVIEQLQLEDLKKYCKNANKSAKSMKEKDITNACLGKAFMKSKKYMTNRVFKTKNARYIIFMDGSFITYKPIDFRNFIGNVILKGILIWFESNTKRYIEVIDPEKPLIFDNKLNSYKRLMHTYTPNKEFDRKTMQYGQIFLDYIKEVLCSGKQEHYEFIEKWIGNVCRGKKNDSALYLKGCQGIGKTTLSEYLIDNIIGKEASLKSDSRPLTSQFNSILKGRTLVTFEELEHFTDKDWNKVSASLKNMITGNTMLYEAKCKDSLELINISNYIIITNHEAIQDSSGRRYFDLDLSVKRKGDTDYWSALYDKDTVYNEKTGEYLFNYFYSKCPDNWMSQKNMPMTDNKLDNFAKLLHPVYTYLKENFINEGKDLRISLRDLYDSYCDNLSDKTKKVISIQQFNSKMKEVGLECKRIGQNKLKFDYSINDLKRIAKTNNWYHEFEEVDINLDVDGDADEISDNIDYKKLYFDMKKAYSDIVLERDSLLNDIEKLNRKLKNKETIIEDPFAMDYDSELSSDTDVDDSVHYLTNIADIHK